MRSGVSFMFPGTHFYWYSLCKLPCIFSSICPYCPSNFDLTFLQAEQWSNIRSIHYACTGWHPLRLQYNEYFLFWTHWWKHIKSSNLHVPPCTAVLYRPLIERTNFVPKALTSLANWRQESLIKAFVPTREFCNLFGLKFLLGSQECIRSTASGTNSHLIQILWWRNYVRSSNFPDSSQACSCSAFIQEKQEFIGQNYNLQI